VKRATLVLAVLAAACLAYTAGCGSGAGPARSTIPDLPPDHHPIGHNIGNSPEWKLRQMQTPQQKTAYLQELAKDPKFDAKNHKDILEDLAKDQDQDLSNAAKDLLDKAK
jgi:hypothetical protein